MKKIQDKVEGISEQTAQMLSHSFESLRNSPPFWETECKQVYNHFLVRACFDLYYNKVHYLEKLQNSTLFTRWYYRKKYITVCNNLLEVRKLISEV